eukprot:8623412-Karenia_brevis.AAC.1
MRGTNDDHVSDLTVREQLEADAVEVLLRKKRMIYLSRILRKGPPVLLAMLQTTNRGKRMPWWMLILKDFGHMRISCTKLMEMPDPEND